MSADPSSLEVRNSPLGRYRVRGRETTRLEGFSDAVFGFSATLLVVSLEVPQTFADLVADLQGFGAFGLSFLTLIFIWLAHTGYFRRYGLHDSWVTLLNMVLLFVVLFFVYPLKFLSVSFIEQLFGFTARRSSDVVVPGITSDSEVGTLFVIYGLGFAAVFLCFALLYRRAIAQRETLKLSALELHDARSIYWHYMIMVLMAVFSVLLVAVGVGQRWGGIGGWIYAFLGPIMYLYWFLRGRRRDKLEATLAG